MWYSKNSVELKNTRKKKYIMFRLCLCLVWGSKIVCFHIYNWHALNTTCSSDVERTAIYLPICP